MSNIYRDERITKLINLKNDGFNPYPHKFEITKTFEKFINEYNNIIDEIENIIENINEFKKKLSKTKDKNERKNILIKF